MEEEFTLKELHKLVWSKPLTTIAKEYGISDNGIRKICKKYKIPLAPNGYCLKKIDKRTEAFIPYKHDAEFKDVIVVLTKRDPSLEVGKTKLQLLDKEISGKYCRLLENTNRLYMTIPLIKLIKSKAKVVEADYWYRRYKKEINESIGNINFRMEVGTLNRALIITNILYKIFVNYGFNKDSIQTGVLQYGEIKVYLNFREMLKIVIDDDKSYYSSQRLESNGNLELSVNTSWHGTKIWKDGKNNIESRLSKIAAEIIIFAEEKNLEIIKWNKENEEKEQYYKLQKIKQLAIQKDNDNLKQFASDYKSWLKMMQLKDFISLVENTNVSPESEMQKQNWLTWAKSKVSIMDPMADGVENYINSFELVEIPDTEFDA